MNRARLTLAGLVVFLVFVACLSPTALVTPAPPTDAPRPAGTDTPDEAATELAAEATMEAELDAEATAFQALEDAALTAEAEETEQAARAEATADAQDTQVAQERAVTRTAQAEATLARATASARGIADEAARLMAGGFITRSDGTFFRPDDFSESWAQINWYQWWGTGYAPADFVVRAHFHWNSASNNANWFNSGCGFVFREQDREPYDHYLAYLGLDGIVYIERARNGTLTTLGSARYGRVSIPEGEADFMLAVDGNKITAFVNGTRVVTVLDSGRADGWLNYTLVSGTNRDYGTLCEITDTELWELRPVR